MSSTDQGWAARRIRLPSPRARIGLFGLAALAGLAVVVGGLPVGFLLIAVIVGAAMAVYLPGALFAIYLLVPPFYKGALQPFSPIDITVVLALLNTIQVLPALFEQRERDVSRAGMVLWCAFALLVVGGILWAPDQDLAISLAASWWALAFIPILAAVVRVGSRPAYVRQFLWSIYFLAIPMVVVGLFGLSATERLEVFGANTIEVDRAVLLVPLIGVTFVLHQRSRLMRAITVILVPVSAVVALATGSRGPLLVLLLIMLVGVIHYFSRPRSVNWRLTGAVGALVLASVLAISFVAADLPGLAVERFALLGDFVSGALGGEVRTVTGDTSAGTRVVLAGFALTSFSESPIVGLGTAGFEALSQKQFGAVQGEDYPHNALFHVAADFGLVGVVVFGSLVFLALTRRLPAGSTNRALRIVFVYFLLNSMISRSVFEDRPTWGLLMLLLFIDMVPVERIVPARLRSAQQPTPA